MGIASIVFLLVGIGINIVTAFIEPSEMARKRWLIIGWGCIGLAGIIAFQAWSPIVFQSPLAWRAVPQTELPTVAVATPTPQILPSIVPSPVVQNEATAHPYNPYVTPQYLTGLFTGRTDAQGQALVRSEIGMSIAASGEIADISELPVGSTMGVTLRSTTKQPTVFLMFGEKWFDQLRALQRGDTIQAMGVLDSVRANSVTLFQCEIVSVGHGPR